MIGKVMKRAAFNGCVRYVMNKEEAKLLSFDGVLLGSLESIVQSFHTQRLMKPKIKHPVGHTSLSYSVDDKERLTDIEMVKLAKEYMEGMNIRDTQYILVRHFDNGIPHVHLVYNRIDNNGKVISDKNDRYRNEAVCKKLKDKYGLTYGKGKEKVKQHKLRGKDKTKYQVYHAVKGALDKSANWTDFNRLLKEKGIAVNLKYKGQTSEVQGISFTAGTISFKGSDLDRSFSYSKIDKLLQEKQQKQQAEQRQTNQSNSRPSNQSGNKPSNERSNQISNQSSQKEDKNNAALLSNSDSWGTGFIGHNYDPEEEEFARRMRYEQEKMNNKTNRKIGRSR